MESRKWRKHILLRDWGIEPHWWMNKTMVRYEIDDYMKCLENTEKEIGTTKYDTQFNTLVAPKQLQNCPSFPIKSHEDFKIAKRKILEMDKRCFKEIWQLRLNTNKGILGRASFGLDTALFPDIVPMSMEIINGKTHRELNQLPHVNDGYMLLEKPTQRQPFNIIEKNIVTRDGEILNEHVDKVTTLFNREQKTLIDFGQFMKSCGANQVSFDFWFGNNNQNGTELTFFDFDTDDDNRVMETIERYQ